MTEKRLKELAVKGLVFTGGTIRLALAGIGASMAAFLMIDTIRRHWHGRHALPYDKLKEALKR